MIQIEQVTHRYGRLEALSQLSLEIPAGVHGLLGQNGAGKTTLLRTLATLHHPQQGRVCILGLNPKKHDERLELRRKLGYLPQEFMPYPNFSAFEFVEYIAILKGIKHPTKRRARAMQVLESVGLEDVAHRKAGGFSGGMRRRLECGRVMRWSTFWRIGSVRFAGKSETTKLFRLTPGKVPLWQVPQRCWTICFAVSPGAAVNPRSEIALSRKTSVMSAMVSAAAVPATTAL